jgi:integrase
VENQIRTAMPKLTKKLIDACNPQVKEYFVWDAELPGYGLRVFPTGKKSYMLQYRHLGRTRRIAIGLHGKFTPETARTRAKQLLGEIAHGGNPSADRNKMHKDITVKDLCDLYLKDGCKNKKASTLATDIGRIERHIKPLLGPLKVASVTNADIIRFVKDVSNGKTAATIKTKARGVARVTGGKGAAARTLGLLGGIFSFAAKQELITVNPVRGVERAKDRKLTRFLTVQEVQKLGKALEAATESGINPFGVAAIKLLLLTGCRRSEILSLRWTEIDWSNSCLRLPDSKTGAKVVSIGAAVIEVLNGIERLQDNQFVLPAMRGKGHYVGMQKDWDTIRALAGIKDVRLHDLRRTFGSTAAIQGKSLFTIGQLLGHADPKTTLIYAHLTETVIKNAAENTSEELGKNLNAK